MATTTAMVKEATPTPLKWMAMTQTEMLHRRSRGTPHWEAATSNQRVMPMATRMRTPRARALTTLTSTVTTACTAVCCWKVAVVVVVVVVVVCHRAPTRVVVAASPTATCSRTPAQTTRGGSTLLRDGTSPSAIPVASSGWSPCLTMRRRTTTMQVLTAATWMTAMTTT